MAIIGTAEIEVLPDTRRFAAQTEAQVAGPTEKLGKKLGAILGGALAVGGLYEFGKKSVEAFSEAQHAVLKLDSALESNKATVGLTASAFDGLNKKLLAHTRFNSEASQTVEGQLALYHLTATQIKDLTPLVEDYAARTGKDVTSAAKLAGAAILGKGRALKDVGIAFKDLKDPTKNYTELVDGLRQQVGGFATKEGQTFSGRMAIMKNQIHEFMIEAGSKLVPVLTALVSIVIGTVLPAFGRLITIIASRLAPPLRTLQLGLKALVSAFKEGDVTSDGFVGVMERIGNVLRTIVGGVSDFVSGFTKGTDELGSAQSKWAQWGAVIFGWVLKVEAFIRNNLHAVLGALAAVILTVVVPAFVSWAAGAISAAVATAVAAAPVVLLVAAVAALGFGLVWAYGHVRIFREVVQAVADYFATSFVPQMRAVGAFLVEVWDRIYAAGKAAFDGVNFVVQGFINGPLAFVMVQVGAFSAWWSAHWDEIRAVFVFAFEAIRFYLSVWWEVIVGYFRVAFDVILPIVDAGWQVLQGIFHYTFDLLAGIVRVAWDQVVGVFLVGKDLILGIVGVLLDLVTGHWGRAWNDIKTTVSNVLGDIKTTIGNVLGDIVTTVKNLAGDLFTAGIGIGRSIVDGIAQGVRNIAGDIWTAIRGAIEGGLSHLPGPIKDAARKLLTLQEGGLVPGAIGMPKLAVVHGGEFVLSNDMLRGARSAPVRVAAQTPTVGQLIVEITMPGLATSPEARKLIEETARGEFEWAVGRALDAASAGTGARGG